MLLTTLSWFEQLYIESTKEFYPAAATRLISSVAVTPDGQMQALNYYFQRFTQRSDAEHIQMSIRLAIVITATLYFWSSVFANGATNQNYVVYARWGAIISLLISAGLIAVLLVNPGVSVTRRIVGMLHDVTAVSASMLLGEGGAAAVAAVYLWVTLGNGFRFGTRYLYACALLSFIGFAAVCYVSEFWRSQSTLSINILILLAVVPPYVGSLLSKLHVAKAKLEQQANFDDLTGLLNRPEFEQGVELQLKREHDGHCLLFCDLDHFKKVNDEAGHAAGDQVLADISRIISSCLRGDDLVGRVGGDEFCVFLKNCPLLKAREIAENIRDSIAGYHLAWGDDHYQVGISVGVAPSQAVSDKASLFRLADAACYAAKNAGRNHVHIVNPETSHTDTQEIRSLFLHRGEAAGTSR